MGCVAMRNVSPKGCLEDAVMGGKRPFGLGAPQQIVEMALELLRHLANDSTQTAAVSTYRSTPQHAVLLTTRNGFHSTHGIGAVCLLCFSILVVLRGAVSC